MSIIHNSHEIGAVSHGSREVVKVMQGTTTVWTKI